MKSLNVRSKLLMKWRFDEITHPKGTYPNLKYGCLAFPIGYTTRPVIKSLILSSFNPRYVINFRNWVKGL